MKNLACGRIVHAGPPAPPVRAIASSPEEIYFAVSKIRRFPSVRYGFERQRTEVFPESCPGLVYALWMCDVANVTVPLSCKMEQAVE
jgi:hypothetical protein